MTKIGNTGDGVLRVGIAGLGRSGWGLHAATIRRLPTLFRLTAVTDPIDERGKEAGEAFGCAVYSSVAEIARADDVDLLVVATPSTQHAAQAIEGMENGKHVLVEKPFAVTLAEADEMLATSARTGRQVIGSQNLRYTADFIKLREVVDSGRLGTIVQINIRQHAFRRRWDWQTLSRLGGGALNNDASHVIDQALQLLGDGEPSVLARLVRTPLSGGDAEDHAKILLSMPGGPVVDVEITSACAYPQEKWLVFGTRGTLTGGVNRLTWRYIDPDLLPTRPLASEDPVPDRTYHTEELPWVHEECDLAGETYANSHVRLYRRLYETLRHHRPADITPQSVRRQIAVLERCRAAAVDDIERIEL